MVNMQNVTRILEGLKEFIRSVIDTFFKRTEDGLRPNWKLKLILWGLKHHKGLWFISKIVKDIKIEGKMLTYTSGKAFNPADCKIIDNIKAKRNWVWKEEKDSEGRFKGISGSVG